MAQSDLINSLESLQDYIKAKDNTKSFAYCSPIPEILKTEKCILGGKENFIQN
jgi:hypothetical protein